LEPLDVCEDSESAANLSRSAYVSTGGRRGCRGSFMFLMFPALTSATATRFLVIFWPVLPASSSRVSNSWHAAPAQPKKKVERRSERD